MSIKLLSVSIDAELNFNLHFHNIADLKPINLTLFLGLECSQVLKKKSSN